MNNELFRHFKTWQKQDSAVKSDFIDHLKVHAPWILAHHPEHDCFREHVWKINGLYICKGCLMTAAGVFIGAFVQIVFGWISYFSEEILALIFITLLVPTLLTHYFTCPRFIKHGSRLLLGTLIASAFLLLLLTERWEVKIVIVCTFLLFQNIYSRKRHKKNVAILHSAQGKKPENL